MEMEVEMEAGFGAEMEIRRAAERDMERINELLVQVCMVHHKGRPDLFQGTGNRTYTEDQ